jgi:hypothetical protein
MNVWLPQVFEQLPREHSANCNIGIMGFVKKEVCIVGKIAIKIL